MRRIKQLPPGGIQNHAKLTWWRQRVKQWSVAKLALELGYSVDTVYHYETGCQSNGRPITDRAWKRFHARCAAVDYQRPQDFNWGIVELRDKATEPQP